MARKSAADPLMSYVLAADSYQTIRPVVECLRRQTVKHSLEILLVAPSVQDMSQALVYRDDFAAIRIVSDPVRDLASARAAGVRAASAPLVFIGETHSFPHPELGEIILKAFAAPEWAVVVPAVSNANPRGALSWSGYILDYGRWGEGLPAGEIPQAPVYNAAYRTAVLWSLGDRLPSALDQSDELAISMSRNGHRTLFTPSALIYHANVIYPWHWFWNRFLAGLLVASNRSREWPLARRLIYVAGSPLIPFVLLRRLMPGLTAILRGQPLPWATLPSIALGLVFRCCGEAFGYAGVLSGFAERGMHQYEVHKLDYAGSLAI